MLKNRFILVSFLIELIPFSALAANPCNTVCPNGYKEVGVLFFSQELSKVVDRTNKVWFSGVTDAEKEPLIQVQSLSQIRENLIRLSQECKKVKFLGFHGHGESAVVVFDENDYKNNLNHKTIVETFDGLSCVMAPGAEIEFASCKVGKGCLGQRFLERIGRILLQKGGRIKAPIQKFSVAIYLPTAGSSEYQKVYFNEEGRPFKGSPGKYNLDECKDQLMSRFEKIVKKNSNFFKNGEEQDKANRFRKEVNDLFSNKSESNLNEGEKDQFYISYEKFFNRIADLEAVIKNSKSEPNRPAR